MQSAATLLLTASALLYVGVWATFYWRRMRQGE